MSRSGLAQAEAARYVSAGMVNKFEVWGCNMSLAGLKPCVLTAGLTHLMSPVGDNPHRGVLHERRNQDLRRKGKRDVTRGNMLKFKQKYRSQREINDPSLPPRLGRTIQAFPCAPTQCAGTSELWTGLESQREA